MPKTPARQGFLLNLSYTKKNSIKSAFCGASSACASLRRTPHNAHHLGVGWSRGACECNFNMSRLHGRHISVALSVLSLALSSLSLLFRLLPVLDLTIGQLGSQDNSQICFFELCRDGLLRYRMYWLRSLPCRWTQQQRGAKIAPDRFLVT